MKRVAHSSSSQRKNHAAMGEKSPTHSSKFRDVMVIAEREGLLRGERTQVVRGRMPEAEWRAEVDDTSLFFAADDVSMV